MPTLIDNLNLINSYKSDIKTAIENKGVDMTGVSFGSYADKIGEIETGGTFVTETLSVSVNNTYYPGAGVDGFSQVIVDVPQSVTGYTEKEITEGTYAIYNLNNSASFVHRNVFEADMNLLTVNLPNASYVGSEAFEYCSNLTSVELATCETIYQSAFKECTSLSYVSLPNCKSVYLAAFRSCTSITSVDLPECTYIDGVVFQNCTRLTQVSLPKCSMFSVDTFNGDSSLVSIYCPNCISVSAQAFKNTRLSVIDLPRCISINTSAFENVGPYIESISMPYVSLISWSAFQTYNVNNNISVLDFPYLETAYGSALNAFRSVTKINFPILSKMNAQVFNGSLFEEVSFGNRIYVVPTYSHNTFSNVDTANCSIYVDAAMYDSWVAATGWTSLSAAFVSFGDPTVPMISYSDGVVTGKTWAAHGDLTSVLGIQKNDITEVNLPECRVVEGLYSCNNLSSVNLPECEKVNISAFKFCYSLQYVSIPKCKYIMEDAFNDCTRLSSITLEGSEVCYLESKNAFNPNSNPCQVYVPASLYSDYLVAPNWSLISSRIHSIPEP